MSTIEEANEFLNSYIKEFNDEFSLPINSTKSVFEKQPSEEKINQILAILSNRVIDNGNSIKFQKKYYIPIREDGTKAFFSKGTKVMVIKSFTNELYVNIGDLLYALEEIPEREKYSKNFDYVKEPKIRKPYIPPMSHPWKREFYLAYDAKA